MILPDHDYRALHIAEPRKLHRGLDRIVHSSVGRCRGRSGVLRLMREEAIQIAESSLKYRHRADGKLRDLLADIRTCFRRRKRGYEDRIHEALALLTEVAERRLGLRPYSVQILGALALYRGYLAEMATGEGKSLTACLPAVLAGWTGRPCHIITANDYLAGRDAGSMDPFYSFCGISTGWVSSMMGADERRNNYKKGVVYTTSSEILADFLRDRLRLGGCDSPSRRLIRQMIQPCGSDAGGHVMRGIDTAIVDEADSVLIDEAVTPLIIARPQQNETMTEACRRAMDMTASLESRTDYCVEAKYREITLTDDGRRKVKALCESLPGLWRGGSRREELIVQALTARELYHRDKQYVIQEGRVVIVDEFTGRMMPSRTWQHGLHQAVEAREGLEMTSPSETLGRMSFQRFFRVFRKLSGMTGTARESAAEFWHIYGLPVLTIPTNRPCIRRDLPDRVFCRQDRKQHAIVEDVLSIHETGRPVLVGTRSVRASEELASMLQDRGIPCSLLNAVTHREEAAIVAAAGRQGAVTIATNMAGRGTDIKLGRGVAILGGLHVIAMERHESGRIDRQLFGRCARQGDPGSVQAYISVDDELFQRFVPAPLRRVLAAAVDRGSPGTQRIAQFCLSLAQRSAQRLAYRQRRGVLEMDTWLADALSFTGSGIER
ncbi:MAG: prepilin peptidase [Nitrospiraceae bacterium]|nr:MAG: prepilin peptidase [Nitrospiraceae bacterium]